jgi:hypothetical protein
VEGVGGGQVQQHAAGGLLWPLRGLVSLSQLHLSVQHLLWYPTAWLSHLTQLTLLVVQCDEAATQGVKLPKVEGPAVSTCLAAVVPRLQANHPASLQQLVLYLEGAPPCDVVPSPLPGVSVGVRPDPAADWMGVHEGPRPMQPCRHLPGVWELL